MNLALYWVNISSDGRHPLTVSVGGSRSNEPSHTCIGFCCHIHGVHYRLICIGGLEFCALLTNEETLL